MKKMTDDEIISELKSIVAKIIGTQNLLKDGKEWYALGKLDGIYHKMILLIRKLGDTDESNNIG